MNYNDYFEQQLGTLKEDGNYRVFTTIGRQRGKYPVCKYQGDRTDVPEHITVWCSNDYMAMGQNDAVADAMKATIDDIGAGAGGTRNISGTTDYHVALEKSIADWYQQEGSLVFTSGYVANFTALGTLGEKLPNCIIYSDAMNHNSMIEGMRRSRAEKRVFKHNDVQDLERLLAQDDPERPKVVAFESVYSMDGDIAPIADIIRVAQKYNALTYCDEVHAVGMYGDTGSGVCEQLGLLEEIDIVQGTLGKAVGQVGGFITGSSNMVDFVRSFGAGFIFTTSLPPAVINGAFKAIELLKEAHQERKDLHQVATDLKAGMMARKLPVVPSTSHIVPVLVGDADLCKQASDMLLSDYGIYVQPINYPTVAKGTERLRFSPSPAHINGTHVADAIQAMDEVFDKLGLNRRG